MLVKQKLLGRGWVLCFSLRVTSWKTDESQVEGFTLIVLMLWVLQVEPSIAITCCEEPLPSLHMNMSVLQRKKERNHGKLHTIQCIYIPCLKMLHKSGPKHPRFVPVLSAFTAQGDGPLCSRTGITESQSLEGEGTSASFCKPCWKKLWV